MLPRDIVNRVVGDGYTDVLMKAYMRCALESSSNPTESSSTSVSKVPEACSHRVHAIDGISRSFLPHQHTSHVTLSSQLRHDCATFAGRRFPFDEYIGRPSPMFASSSFTITHHHQSHSLSPHISLPSTVQRRALHHLAPEQSGR